MPGLSSPGSAECSGPEDRREDLSIREKILAKKPTYTHGTATVLKKHLLRTEQMWTNHRSVRQTHQHYEITRAVLVRLLSPNIQQMLTERLERWLAIESACCGRMRPKIRVNPRWAKQPICNPGIQETETGTWNKPGSWEALGSSKRPCLNK